MYIKIQQLKKRLNKIPELPSGEDVWTEAVKFKELYSLILNESFATEEIRKITREEWLWLRELLMEYYIGDINNEEFWAAVFDVFNTQIVVGRLEHILAALPSMEVSQYV